jgi:hypothetical protein
MSRYAMLTREKGRTAPTHSWPRHYTMRGQRHAQVELYPGIKDPRYPLDRRLCGPQSWFGQRGYRKHPFASAGDRTPVVQSVVRHYTDWATPVHTLIITRNIQKMQSYWLLKMMAHTEDGKKWCIWHQDWKTLRPSRGKFRNRSLRTPKAFHLHTQLIRPETQCQDSVFCISFRIYLMALLSMSQHQKQGILKSCFYCS